MKTLLQTFVALVVLVGGIGVFSYMSQYARKAPAVKARLGRGLVPDDKTPTITLRVPERVAQWDMFDDSFAEAYEVGAKGHYDFWASNPNKKPVEVTLSQQGCTCQEVQLGIVPAAEVAKWNARKAQYASLDMVSNLFGLPDLAGAVAVVGLPELKQWESFPPPKVGRKTYLVPAASEEAGPQLALIRLKWEAKDAQPKRLSATVEYRIESLLEDTNFEVPIRGVVPLMASTGTISLGELGYNEIRDTGFFCFSATRPDLNVKVEEATPDPCIEISPPRKLSNEELAELPQRASVAGLRMKCAFYIGVKVYERKGANQLDLGPLHRNIRVSAGSDVEQTVALQGSVRSGTITVGDSGERGRIDLGNFKADRLMEKAVTISSPDPNMKLKLVSHSPDALKVTLTEVPSSSLPKRWELKVEIEPRGAAGLLQNGSIVLQTIAEQPRKIRIPVSGNATY
jgi:hypothetical protein